MGYIYHAIQTFFALLAHAFHLLARVLYEVHPRSISDRIMRGPYYWACVAKRKVRGEETWQLHDYTALGIQPPPGHPLHGRPDELLAAAGIYPVRE